MRLLVTFLFLLLHSTASAEPRSCPVEVIEKRQVKNVVDRRQTTFEHCLRCQGDQCEFKDWPEEGKDFAAACRLFFCAPIKKPRKMLLNDGNARRGGVFFTYGIDKKGRIKDVNITEVHGDTTEEMGRQLINNYFARRRYEPIVINGQAYELNGLQDGTNYKWRGVMP